MTKEDYETSCYGAEFDSRKLKGGELFVALPGESAHGEKFLDQAFAKGAALALVEHSELIQISPHRDRLICVSNSLEGFTAIADSWRKRFPIPVIGVAGSIGKTTTKELAAHFLREIGPGVASEKSFNNHIGVPYTICKLSSESKWAVFELGMNHPEELRALSKLARPHVAVITQIAPEHEEFFPSLAAIADAECEVLDGLAEDGILICHGADKEAAAGIQRHEKRSSVDVRRFGFEDASSELDLSVRSYRALGWEGAEFDLSSKESSVHFQTKLIGEHSALNVACAALAAITLFPQLSLERIAQSLSTFEPPPMRLNLLELRNGARVIDDSYNASPLAVAAALRITKQTAASGSRIGAVLGDMLELGIGAEQYHRELGRTVAELGYDFLITVGPLARFYGEEASGVAVLEASSPEEAAKKAIEFGFDLLLVKGSRGIGLERCVSALKGLL